MPKLTVFVSAVNDDCGPLRDRIVEAFEADSAFDFKRQKDLGEAGRTLDNIYNLINSCDLVVMILGKGAGSGCPEPAVEPFLDRLQILSRAKLEHEYARKLTYTLWEGAIALACGKQLAICLGPDAKDDPEVASYLEWLFTKWRIRPDVFADPGDALFASVSSILKRTIRRRYEGPTRHLFPSRYDSFRVARTEFVDYAVDKLKAHGRLVLYGQAGLGKTTMASEVSVAMVERQETLFTISISWIDVLAPTGEQTRENLLLALQREMQRDGIPDLPGKKEFLDLTSFESLNRETARILSQCAIVVNDLERGMDSSGVRKLASEVLQRLFDLRLSEKDERTRPPYIILTSRPGPIALQGESYQLRDIRASKLADCVDKKLPKYAICLPLLSAEESKMMVRTYVGSLQAEYGFLWEEHEDSLKALENTVATHELTPLELLLLCELTVRTIRKPNFQRRLQKWTEILRPIEAPATDDVVADCFHSLFPISGLYEELWKLIEMGNLPELADNLEKALAVFSLGLNRTSMNLYLEHYSDAARLILAHPDDRARALGSAADEEYVYELAHPTVIHLAALRGVTPNADAFNILKEGGTLNPYLEHERQLLEIFCSDTCLNPLPHDFVELEPRAVCLLLASKLGIYSELAAYFAAPFDSDGEEEDEPSYRERLTAKIREKVKEACDQDPSLILATCRLGETAYQQLDEWNLRDALVGSLWEHESYKPTCVQRSGLGDEYRQTDWYADIRDLEVPHSLGREYLRQAELVRWLENVNEASDFPGLDDIKKFDKAMEVYYRDEDNPSREDIVAAFANYLFLISCLGEIVKDLDLKLEAAELSQNWFAKIGLSSDVVRASLNPIFPTATIRSDRDIDRKIVDPTSDPSLRQELIYEHVLKAYDALKQSFGKNPATVKAKIDNAKTRIRLAAEAFGEWPGDEWIGYQIGILRAGFELVVHPQEAGDDLDSWDRLAESALQFFEDREIHYCSVLLLWNDLLKRIAYESAINDIPIEEVLRSAPWRDAFFKFLHLKGEDRYLYFPDGFEPDLPDEVDALEALEGTPIGLYTIATVIDRYASVVLSPEERAEIVGSPTGISTRHPIQKMLKKPLSVGKTNYGTWEEGILRLIPGLESLPGEKLPIPPFVMVEALLYRSLPKGVTKWCERS